MKRGANRDHLRHVGIVSEWEFTRFFRWKEQVISFGIFVLVALVWIGAAKLASTEGGDVTIAVRGMAVPAVPSGRIHFVAAPSDSATWARALAKEDLSGVLTRRGDAFELQVAKDPRYRDELLAYLGESLRRERLLEAGLSPEKLAEILAPAEIATRFTDASVERRSRAEKPLAMIFAGLLLVAVFTSMSYILTGISGEKQLRVTESVLSAISPQAWIDGKVLGASAFALVTVLNMVLGGLLLSVVGSVTATFTLPSAAARPEVILGLVLYTLLGLLLWNSFFAAISATLDDPHTSNRSSVLLLPVVPVVLSLVVVKDPDFWLSRVLALFPLTSAPAMPARIVLSDPPLWEVLFSIALLAGSVWLTRRMAGRIFEIGMLLYGKEPTLPEILRWARTPRR